MVTMPATGLVTSVTTGWSVGGDLTGRRRATGGHQVLVPGVGTVTYGVRRRTDTVGLIVFGHQSGRRVHRDDEAV